MSFVTLAAALKTKLETLTSLAAVHDYEKSKLDNFPVACITASDSPSDTFDTGNNLRDYSFTIRIYDSREDNEAESEARMRAVVDEIIDALDNSQDLGGACHFLKPAPSKWGYTDQAAGGHRTAEIEIVCRVLSNHN